MSETLRILFVHAAIHGLPPEYQVHRTLAKTAERHGVESFFVWQSSSSPLPGQDERISYYDFGRDMSLVPKPSRTRRGLMMYRRFPGAIAHLVKAMRRWKPHVLYTSQQTHDLDLVRAATRIIRVPHLIHIHYAVGPWLGTALDTIRRTPRLLAVSEFIRQTALLQGVSPPSIHTVPNTIPLGRGSVPAERGRIRSEFAWEAGCPVILSAGRLDPGKGHLALIEAFSAVVKRVPEARLLICGRSTGRENYRATLERRAAELGVARFVHFAGYRSDLDVIMKSADVFCLPTEMEPFGLVFLEAMAAGLPTVACWSGAVPEVVLHGVTGFLSYPGDTRTLADHLVSLLVDKELARRFGESGKARVHSEFTPERVTDVWLDRVRRLVDA